jgi:hypothetical protein
VRSQELSARKEALMKTEYLAKRVFGERAVLNLAEIAGQPYLNHWYVLIAATRGG